MSYQTLQASMLKRDAQKQIRLVTASDVKPAKPSKVHEATPIVTGIETATMTSGPLSSELRLLMQQRVVQIAVARDSSGNGRHYIVQCSRSAAFLPVRLRGTTTTDVRYLPQRPKCSLPHKRTIRTTDMRRLRMIVQVSSLERLVATRQGDKYRLEWEYTQ